MTEIKYQSTILSVAIHRPADSPIFGDFVTKIRVEDEGGGPFIALSLSEYRGGRKAKSGSTQKNWK